MSCLARDRPALELAAAAAIERSDVELQSVRLQTPEGHGPVSLPQPPPAVSPFPHAQLYVETINGEKMPTYMRWLAIAYALTVPRDPGRYVVGRMFRLAAVIGVAINPLWRFRSSGTRIDDPRRPYVVVSNHESYADIFLISHLPWEMKWLSKDTIFKIPVMGWMMSMAGDIRLTPANNVGFDLDATTFSGDIRSDYVRYAATSAVGRSELRSKPNVCSNWIHWQSTMSVFRRSLTDFRLDGFARTTSIPRASRTSSSGMQYTPVASTATVVTPHSMIQSAS